MNVFAEYADYYDLFYADKNYKTEVDYVDSLIKKYSKNPVRNILVIGCGTGNHDVFLSEKGYQIDAIDMSEKMIEIAKNRNLKNVKYIVSSSINFNSPQKYDCIISLFHVLSYHNSNDEVDKMFKIASKNLNPGGIFIFDFWYGPGVLNDPPVVRVKEFETESEQILRIAQPATDFSRNIVSVNYRLLIKNKLTNLQREICETHNMRYFFEPELQFFAEKNQITNCKIFEWLTERAPEKNTWNGIIIGRAPIEK